MAIEIHTINVTDETTLDEVLNAADDGSIRIERDGVTYTVQRGCEPVDDDVWKDYDPAAVIAMLDDFERNPMDIDAKKWISDIYNMRRESARAKDHP